MRRTNSVFFWAEAKEKILNACAFTTVHKLPEVIILTVQKQMEMRRFRVDSKIRLIQTIMRVIVSSRYQMEWFYWLNFPSAVTTSNHILYFRLINTLIEQCMYTWLLKNFGVQLTTLMNSKTCNNDIFVLYSTLFFLRPFEDEILI